MKKNKLIIAAFLIAFATNTYTALVTIKNGLKVAINISWKNHYLYPDLLNAKVLKPGEKATLYLTNKSLEGPLTVLPAGTQFSFSTKPNSYFLPFKKWHIKKLEVQKYTTSDDLKIKQTYPKDEKRFSPMNKDEPKKAL